jgi:protein-S-isoprenylcysteine O-methyltransferase Ste14
MEFADYHLPGWAGCVGIAILAANTWLRWRAHTDLGHNWSSSLAIWEDHSLVTGGIYAHIRHPIYAALWLWAVAQPLLLHNWIAGLGGLTAVLPLHLIRVPREEQMMLEQFGRSYAEYASRTGRYLPRLRR